MKRMLVFVAAGFFLFIFYPHHAWAFGVKDVVLMSQDGIPDSLIVEKIHHSGKRFRLNAKDLHNLKQAGVSNDVVVAMLRTEDSGDTGDYGAVSPWRPYYSPYYSPWNVGFGFYGSHYRGYAPGYMGSGYGRGYYGHGGFGGGGYGGYGGYGRYRRR